MKTRYSLLLFFVVSSLALRAQQWTRTAEMPLPDTLRTVDIQFLSLNADTLLDAVMLTERRPGTNWLLAWERIESAWAIRSQTQISLANISIQHADWNRDGRQDVLIRGRNATGRWTLTGFESNGDFTWKQTSVAVESALPYFRVADADEDGRPDLFLFGEKGFEVLKTSDAGFKRVYERTDVQVKDVALFRLFRTHTLSWIISGIKNGRVMTEVLVPDNALKVKVLSLSKPVSGRLAVADFNEDGWFDIAAVGSDSLGLRLRTWHGDAVGFAPVESRAGLYATHFFAANLNEDRGVEQILIGSDSLSQPRAWVVDSALSRIEMPWRNSRSIRFADLDRDGDLDGLVIADSLNRQWMKVFENRTTPEDKRPTVPMRPAAFSLYGRTLIFWQPSSDDRTDSKSITYDVWLGKQATAVVSPEFDLSHFRRTAVSRGNAGNTTVFRVRALTDGRYFYTIQAIDNALNGSYEVCSGGVLPCFDLEEITKQVCQNEAVTLTAPGDAAWYSIRAGFLAQGRDYTFTALQPDTLLSIVPQSSSCADHKVWIINVNPALQNVRELRHVCLDAEVALGIPAGWRQVTWQTTPPQINRDTIRFRVLKNEKVTVVASAGKCEWRKEFDLRVSKPEITALENSFRILKGAEVNLSVTASPGRLQWLPATGLSLPNAVATLATPPRTTEYLITLTDSVGCRAEARIRVAVDFTAFVPNLFSPNADDSNDRLLVYGIDQTVSEFRFQIFNREGNLVYQTEDVIQAMTLGWNGYAHGVRQSAGIYYWKVSGKTAAGETLLLNGKTSGDILMVY